MFSSKITSTPDDKKFKDKTINELINDYAGKLSELDLVKEVSKSMDTRLEKRRQVFDEEKKKLVILVKLFFIIFVLFGFFLIKGEKCQI